MIKVYMETNSTAELVAIFENEETYLACLPALEKLKKKHNFDEITESVESYSIDDLVIDYRNI